MSSETPVEAPDGSEDDDGSVDDKAQRSVATTNTAGPLTIDLPDGTESVSDAILAHREMLLDPEANGLATAQDITHCTEAVENLSERIQETANAHDRTEATVEDLEKVVETQRRQIQELQSVIESIMDILGTSADWDTFESSETATPSADD